MLIPLVRLKIYLEIKLKKWETKYEKIYNYHYFCNSNLYLYFLFRK